MRARCKDRVSGELPVNPMTDARRFLGRGLLAIRTSAPNASAPLQSEGLDSLARMSRAGLGQTKGF